MRSPSVAGSGSTARDDVARRHLCATHGDGLGRVEAELVQRLQHLDELAAEAVLERDALALHPARDQHDLLVLHVDAFDRTDALRELEHLGLRERRGRVEAALALPDRAAGSGTPRSSSRSRRSARTRSPRRRGRRRRARPPRRCSRTARRPRDGRRRPTARARRRCLRARARPPGATPRHGRAGSRPASRPAARRAARGGGARASSPCRGT